MRKILEISKNGSPKHIQDVELEELVRHYRLSGSSEDLGKVIEMLGPVIGQLAKKYAARACDVEDMESEGAIAVTSAADSWKDDKKLGFLSYSWGCIKNRMLSVRQDYRFPVSLSWNAKKLLAWIATGAVEGMTARKGYAMAKGQFKGLRWNTWLSVLESGDWQQVAEEEANEIAEEKYAPPEDIEAKVKKLEKAMTKLSPRDREITLRYWGVMGRAQSSLVSMAAEYGMTRAGLSRVQLRAVQKLRRHMT